MKTRHPVVGFVGMALMLAGLFTVCKHVDLGLALIVAGGVVLGLALLTGNVKLFG